MAADAEPRQAQMRENKEKQVIQCWLLIIPEAPREEEAQTHGNNSKRRWLLKHRN